MQTQIAKTVLRAPIAGMITKQDAEVGEIAEQYKPLVGIIGAGGLEIEAQVPEIDIGALNISNPVSITIDAFPDETFEGRVGFIDPAETLIDGVVNFKIKVFFDAEDTRIKSGLTSNLSIETARAENVLLIPESAITQTPSGFSVTKIVDGLTRDTEVVLGIRGEQSLAEVVSGLSEGDLILSGRNGK